MKLIDQHKYKIIGMTIMLIMVLSLLNLERSIELQQHDTYYVIDIIHLGIFFSLFLGTIGTLYWLLRNKCLINWLISLHLITTIISLLGIVLISIFFEPFHSPVKYGIVSLSLVDLAVAALLSQVLFLLNLLISALDLYPSKD